MNHSKIKFISCLVIISLFGCSSEKNNDKCNGDITVEETKNSYHDTYGHWVILAKETANYNRAFYPPAIDSPERFGEKYEKGLEGTELLLTANSYQRIYKGKKGDVVPIKKIHDSITCNIYKMLNIGIFFSSKNLGKDKIRIEIGPNQVEYYKKSRHKNNKK